jgi:hypothetical protein
VYQLLNDSIMRQHDDHIYLLRAIFRATYENKSRRHQFSNLSARLDIDKKQFLKIVEK